MGGSRRLSPGRASNRAIFSRPDEQRNWTLLVSSAVEWPLKAETVVLEAPLRFAKDGAPQDLLKITNESGSVAATYKIALVGSTT